MPGDWLLTIARVFFDDTVVSSVITPTIADFRQELLEAEGLGAQVAARWHGYAAFWTLVLMSPFAFSDWPGRKQHARSMVVLTVVTIALAVAIGGRVLLDAPFQWVMEHLPAGTFGVLSAASGWAFLAGPLAIAFIFVRRRYSRHYDWQVDASVVVVLGLLSFCIGVVLNASAVFHTFEGVGQRGSAGLFEVSRGITGASEPLVVSALGSLTCCVGAALLVLRDARRPPTGLAMSTRSAVALSMLIVFSLVAVDQLMRVQQEGAYWALSLLGPYDRSVPNSALATASGMERTIMTMLIWGTILTLAVLVSGIVIWRSTRSGARHPLLVWTTRIGVAAALAGAIWHAGVANWYANAFDNLFTQAQQIAAQTQPRR